MQIDWPRYVRTAKEQELTGIEVVRLIQKETNRKVNVSEVKRRVARTESSALNFEADTVDVIDLIEEDQPQEVTLHINANGMAFEFRALNPEDSVVSILRKMNRAAWWTFIFRTCMSRWLYRRQTWGAAIAVSTPLHKICWGLTWTTAKKP